MNRHCSKIPSFPSEPAVVATLADFARWEDQQEWCEPSAYFRGHSPSHGRRKKCVRDAKRLHFSESPTLDFRVVP